MDEQTKATLQVLEAQIAVQCRALDDLVGACMDDKGNPKAPDRAALMKARAMIAPAHGRHAFRKPV